MKGIRSHVVIHEYAVGDVLLEADRYNSRAVAGLKVMGGTGSSGHERADELFDIVKPKPDDLPALKSALEVMKFSDENVIELHEALGGVINLASGIATGVGAFFSAASLISSLLGPEEDATAKKLEHISKRVDQIYGYLAAEERRGLHDEASQWRRDLGFVRRAVQHAKGSRSRQNLDELREMALLLDNNLQAMLDPGKGDIAFLRAAYGHAGGPGMGGHWVDAAVSPFMNLSSGAEIDYQSSQSDLQATIWDPGHYIDVLVQGLSDRLLLASTLEPAFRTTGYHLGRLKDLVKPLDEFVSRWRNSLIVANPLAGLNGGNALQHPITDAPPGIVIGAIDPVSGVGFFHMWWGDFTMLEIWNGSIFAKGSADETRAKDPGLALARAQDLQPRLFNGVMTASGMGKFAEIRSRIQRIVSQPTVGSDFVDLPNANFERHHLDGPFTADPVELGVVGTFGQRPGRSYSASRFRQTFEKTFRFNAPIRGDMSLIQPGYRLTIGNVSIPLIPFSNAPADGGAVERFPTKPIKVSIERSDWSVCDVYQSRVFSDVDEDVFEGADPSIASLAIGTVAEAEFRIAGGGTASAVPSTDVAFRRAKPERMFVNERRGKVNLDVEVSFDADLSSPDYPYVGSVTVRIRNRNVEQAPDGAIVPIAVYEERLDAEQERAEWLADQ